MSTIYLDHPATTPCDPRVIDAMIPWMSRFAANASQLAHAPGRAAAEAVELARGQVAATAGLDPERACVTFTAGATEANNLALLGMEAALPAGARIVIGATEHASVLAPARQLRSRGFDVQVIGVDGAGQLLLRDLERAMTPETSVVSIQAVNNETGVLHPLSIIGALAREVDAVFHVDAVQAFGKVPLNPVADNIDLLSISAHKFGGPTGVGALIAADRFDTRRRIAPMLHGGGQELGLRPGTTNLAGVVGMGVAARISRMSAREELHRLTELHDHFEQRLLTEIPTARINGGAAPRGPVITSLSVPGIDARALLATLPMIAASTTSACSSGGTSHVLSAMGLSPEAATGTMRFGIGRTTTRDLLDRAVDLLVAALAEPSRSASGAYSRTLAFA